MSLTIKFFCFLLVLGFAGLFFIKKPDGTPWLSLNDLKPDVSLTSVTETIEDMVPQQSVGGEKGKVPVYRWKNEAGAWQFSDTPPNHALAEQILVDTDLNRDLAEKIKIQTAKKNTEQESKTTFIKDSGANDSSIPSVTTISPSKIGQLVNDAKNVQKMMDDRTKQLESAR